MLQPTVIHITLTENGERTVAIIAHTAPATEVHACLIRSVAQTLESGQPDPIRNRVKTLFRKGSGPYNDALLDVLNLLKN